jgi:hypothetical protein
VVPGLRAGPAPVSAARKTKSMSTSETRETKRSLGARMLALPEEDPTESRHSKIFVEVPGGSGPDRKVYR